jgi:DNA-binding SARP family transcriptional activator
VAATTVRRALDPSGSVPSNTYLDSRGRLLRLCIEQIDVDVESFLSLSAAALSSTAPEHVRARLLAEALAVHGGDIFVDEPEELWAQDLQREVHLAFFAVCHALAESSAATGDSFTRLDCYRRILAVDPYDQRAHEGQLDALEQLGAVSQLAEANKAYAQRMAELGISPDRRVQ